MNELEIITVVPLLILLAVATLIDWRTHSIPNALSLGGALFGIILQASIHGPTGLVLALSGWAVCLVCFLPFYLSGGMAAGDVKLMAGVGAFLGPIGGIAACLVALVVGALIAIISLASERYLHSTNGRSDDAVAETREGLRARIPYAGAIAAGTALSLFQPVLLTKASLLAQNGVFV